MTRIVQDSDDELDEDLEADLPTSQQPHASGQRPGGHNPQSTGDIDALGRPTVGTWNVHLQPLPSQDVLQSSVSLPDSEHPNKRRKTELHPSPGPSPFGIYSKGNHSTAHGKNADYNPSSPSMHNASTHLLPGEILVGEGLVDLPEVAWNLEGTMRNDYDQHDPSMFGEPSSTVPNATMTQLRVLEAVKAPVMLGQGTENEGPCYQPPPEPSVPWSDLMKFTPAEMNEQSESPTRRPQPYTSSSTPALAVKRDHGLPSSSLHFQESPLENDWDRTERDPVDSETVVFKNNSQTISEASRHARPEDHDNKHADDQKSPFQQHSQPPPSSDDELTAIGLPGERYKPRPSRSRSIKPHTEDSIDYSIRPEKAMKVSKRRRTTAEMRTASSITTPEKVRQICDMGFTPSTTARALKRNNGDVIQTVDWLVTNNIGHDELAPQSPSKPTQKQRKRDELPSVDAQAVQDIMRGLNDYRRDDDDELAQSAQSVVPDTDGIAAHTEHNNTTTTITKSDLPSEASQNMSPTKVQVIIPKKASNTAATKSDDAASVSTKKTKRRKTASDQPEAESSQTAVSAPEVVTDKKRGRGRPKKTATTNEVMESFKFSEQDAKSKQPSESPQNISPTLVTEKVNPDLEMAPEKAEPIEPVEPVEPVERVSPETTNQSNPSSKPSSVAAPEMSETSTKPTTASPMTKGKVPYRVGLSKRARIAPLLRTLKK